MEKRNKGLTPLASTTESFSDQALAARRVASMVQGAANAALNERAAARQGNSSTRLVADEALQKGLANASESDYGRMVNENYYSREFWELAAIIASLKRLASEAKGQENPIVSLLLRYYEDDLMDATDLREEIALLYRKVAVKSGTKEKDVRLTDKIDASFMRLEMEIRGKITRLLGASIKAVDGALLDPSLRVSLTNKSILENLLSEWEDFLENLEHSDVSPNGENAIIPAYMAFRSAKQDFVRAAAAHEEHLRPKGVGAAFRIWAEATQDALRDVARALRIIK